MTRMRKAAFRVFAVALLALLMPVQGIASVTAGQCRALEHHWALGGDEHGEHGEEHAVGPSGSTATDTPDGEGNGSHCGPCTACCASATIGGPAALSYALPASDTLDVVTRSLPPSVQLDGLDRPPLAL